MPKTSQTSLMNERGNLPRSREPHSRHSRGAGTSAQITLSGSIGLRSKPSLIRLAFLSVNKPFRVFCYPCIPIEKENPCENFFPPCCCVFLLCLPFLRKSSPPTRSEEHTSELQSLR